MNGERPTLFVVEDNADTAELLYTLLEDDYDVVLAKSLKEALGQAEGRRFDLFLFDVNLGDGTGSELLQRLREHGAHARVPAIACTAYALSDLDFEGFDAYLRKPFEIEELLRTLAALLRR